MRAIVCPSCKETERLSGKRRPDHTLEISCQACGAVWERDATRRCNACGSTDLEYAPRPLWAKGRGDQHTPAGRIDAWSCRDCGAHDVTASRSPATTAGAISAGETLAGEPHVPAERQAAPASPGDAVATAPAGEEPARRLLALQHLDAELDRLRALSANLPEQRQADATAAKLSQVAKALMALVQEWNRLQAAGMAGSADGRRVQEALAQARSQGEELAAQHRGWLEAVPRAAPAAATGIVTVQARRDALVPALGPSVEAYEALRRRVRDPVAVVVDIGTCGGCRIVIPPSERERARELAASQLARCPGCDRFLVFGG